MVEVRHHSPKCIVEQVAEGPTVAKALDPRLFSVAARDETKRLLVEYHKAVFSAFVNDGLIHSDIHLGNAVQGVVDDKGTTGFILFDVGQFDRIAVPETIALLWTLSSISSIERRTTLRHVALTHLAEVSTLTPELSAALAEEVRRGGAAAAAGGGDAKALAALDKKVAVRRAEELRLRLWEAYAESIEPLRDGTLPNQRAAYMLLLRAAEKRGILLPNGSFSVAKMVDGIISQQKAYDLENVLDDGIEAFLRNRMSWQELGSIMYQSVRYSAGTLVHGKSDERMEG